MVWMYGGRGQRVQWPTSVRSRTQPCACNQSILRGGVIKEWRNTDACHTCLDNKSDSEAPWHAVLCTPGAVCAGAASAALLAALDLAVDVLGIDARGRAEGGWASIAGGRGARRSSLHGIT